MNPVDNAFETLRAGVTESVTPPPAERIVARGRRRRAARVGLVAAVALAVLAAGAVALGPRPEAMAPAGPGTGPAVTTGPTGPRWARPGIPRGFMLDEDTAASRTTGVDAAGPCLGRPLLSAGIRHGDAYFQDLYVYGDTATARAAFARLRGDLARCLGWDGALVLAPQSAPAWGDEAAAITLSKPADGAGEHTGDPLRLIVVRVGPSVAVHSGYPATPAMDADAQAIVPRLCYFDPDCRPAAGLPPPVVSRAGLTLYAAVLAEYAPDDDGIGPGEAIAAAAAHGYRPETVHAECDGAAPGRLRVAVYFAARGDAERFAALVPATVQEVRARCS